MKDRIVLLLIFFSTLSIAQQQYPEQEQSSNIAGGVYYQTGPGSNNSSLNWQYPYGTKLTVSGSACCRNFELISTSYPFGELKLRQWNSTENQWTQWRSILMENKDGNVGVGFNNPGSRLHVFNGNSGGITHDFSDLTIEDNDNAMINLLSPNNKTGYYGFSDTEDNYVGGMQYVHATNSMIFRVNDHVNDMTINQDGNVGIGIDNPTAKLQVEGQTRVGKWGVLALDWTNEPNWGGSSNKWAGYIGFNATRNNEDPKDNYKGPNRYTSKGVFEGSNYGFRWLYRNHNNHDSDGQHQLTEYMRLSNNGNLGIGTTNPDAKLTVKGDIHTQEVKVDLNGAVAPDYVFLEDYDLKSIEDVEAYINDQGHLPNIPSAAEMEKNGIELKQMNLQLLEKIEELTLYTIAQEKELQKQKNKNSELETRLEKLEALLLKK